MRSSSWSLSALIVCYALFPLFWRTASKVRPVWLLPLFGLALLAAFEVLAEVVFDHALADWAAAQAGVSVVSAQDKRVLLMAGILATAVVAVPEPDTYARMLGGGRLLMAWMRRRQRPRD